MKKLTAVILMISVCVLAFAACAQEDTQNPVMNIIGFYMDETSQRAGMNILCEGTDSAAVIIDWASSASENTEWKFSGVYNTEDNTISYDNCVKMEQLYSDTGVESSEVLYENGSGKLIINEDWSISWINDMEDTGSDCLFTFAGAPIISDIEEDGQNPVMNIIGPYMDEISGRAGMYIECEGTDGAVVTIDWADSASVNVEWIFHGVYDTADNSIAYTDCVKLIQTYAEDGSVSEETVYTDGSGKLIVNEDWSISWINDSEETGNDCHFIFG